MKTLISLIVALFLSACNNDSNSVSAKSEVSSTINSTLSQSKSNSRSGLDFEMNTKISIVNNQTIMQYFDEVNQLQHSQILLFDEVYNGQIIVITSKNTSLELTQTQEVADTFIGTYQTDATTESAYTKQMQLLLARDDVIAVEPNYKSSGELIETNDPQTTLLWGLEQIGINKAWNNTTGSKEIVVAVIDTGIDYTHTDLRNNIWINSDEIAGNGLDDDNNGIPDDIFGVDFANMDTDPMDDHGHGTHVAGTIGAVGNNGVGVVGINQHVSLMPIKVLSANGSGSTLAIFYSMVYAIQNGADVINMSLGGYGFSFLSYVGAYWVNQANIVFVVAAGNEANNNDINPSYPASFPFESIISVAANDENDIVASFSNYGKTTVDVTAPGVNIYSTFPNGGYGFASGTSMAAPHVAGASALLLASGEYESVVALKHDLLSKSDAIINSKPMVAGRLNLGNIIGELITKEIDVVEENNETSVIEDENNSLSNLEEEIVDNTELNKIESFVPSDNSIDIGLFDEIQITFNKELSSEDIKKIQIQFSENIEFDKSYIEKTLTLRPSSSYESQKNYKITIKIVAEDNSTIFEKTWEFTTQ